jgi:DNA modification methylase
LWDGGDPDCDHKATAGEPRKFTNGRGEGTDDDYAGSNLRSWTTRDGTAFRDECGKCGARRVDQQIGLEATPDEWVARLVVVFREVRRVLRDDGTLWVEIGDSYLANSRGASGGTDAYTSADTKSGAPGHVPNSWSATQQTPTKHPTKPKDLLGQPWLLAFALRADGWYLRSEIIWARPNPMPESVTDRPTKSHSTVFLLSKQPRYFYDADAIREAPGYRDSGTGGNRASFRGGYDGKQNKPSDNGFNTDRDATPEMGANARSVWNIPTQPTPFAHFATWPEALVRRMILAGTSERGCCPECGAPWVRDVEKGEPEVDPRVYSAKGATQYDDGLWAMRVMDGTGSTLNHTVSRDTVGWSPSCHHDHQPVSCTVLDPFAGSATTMLVARNHGRRSIGIELNEDYLQIAAKRLQQLSLFSSPSKEMESSPAPSSTT